jgi:hypothetical protein
MITVIFVVMLAIGYGIWSEETSGTIVLFAPVYGTEMFVDGKLAGLSEEAGQKMSYNYSEGKHSVIVSHEGFWPWKKDLSLAAKTTITLKPFIVRKEVKPSEIPRSSYDAGTMTINQDYTDAMTKFNDLSIKEEFKKPLLSTGIGKARSVDYYPGRTDVLLVAVNNGIFAVETGTTTPRNFEPVFEGKEPVFIKDDNNVLIIKDGDSLYRLFGFEK